MKKYTGEETLTGLCEIVKPEIENLKQGVQNAQSTADAAKTTAEAALPLSGGTLTGMLHGGLNYDGSDFLYRNIDQDKLVISRPTVNSDGVDIRFSSSGSPPVTALIAVTVDGIKTPVNDFEAANKTYVDNSIIRHNYADNPYFRNPINQRAQNKYVGATYTIDRWKNSAGTNTTSELTDNGIKFTSTASSNMFRQDVDNVKQFAGHTVTVSILGNGEASNTISAYIRAGKSDGTNVNAKGNPISTSLGVSEATLTIPENVTSIYFGAVGSIDGGSAIIIAAKMEIGPNQTLAHQESNTWVLNEILDYATELAKCQRYFYRIKVAPYARVGYGTGSANQFVMSVPIPEMRSSPTIQASNVTWHTSPNALQVTNISSFSSPIGREAQILCTTSSTSTDVVPFMRLRNMTADTIGYIDFNADL